MGLYEKIRVFHLTLGLLYCGNCVAGEDTTVTDIDIVTTIAPGVTSGALETSGRGSDSVRVVDFVGFAEDKHEAEFIVELGQSSGDIKIINQRSLQNLWSSTVTTSGGGSKTLVRVKVTVPCKTKYTLYPYDTSACTLLFLPGGDSWENGPSSARVCGGGMEAYEFHVTGYQSMVIPSNSTREDVDMLSLTLLVQRTSGTQVFGQMYSPMTTLTFVSFITMWWGSASLRIVTSMAIFLCSIVAGAIFWQDIPREKDEQTVTEYFMAFCVGFIFEVVFTNIAILGYLSKGKTVSEPQQGADIEANGDGNKVTHNGNGELSTEKQKKLKVRPKEMHILTMGKCHQFTYFKCLRPAKCQLPIFFVIFFVIFFIIVFILAGIMPEGFVPVSQPATELERLCL